ncbi:LrgB family protein [Propionibacterium cyclohexanicum]|uniref:LrgB family protein n=1 Tax=Propionibacterium cyclohexanicum TaxID=64702 RepID=UPI001C431B48|nr:LrgB family protein [Propionibacterium cyclohexanicum]
MSPVLSAIIWSVLTIVIYLVSKKVHAHWTSAWTMPLLITPAVLIVLVLVFNVKYTTFHHDTSWLVTLLGPTTVAFAVPIWRQRHLIRTHWAVLLVGVLVGSGVAIGSSFLLATVLGIRGALRLSLLPRSISTPFAMTMSTDIGGNSDLTSVFVVLTGILGVIVGEALLTYLPLRTELSKGMMLGMGAHGMGTAKAQEVGTTEGAIAGLAMVLSGVMNVLLAPVLALMVG